jgi:hypothetical protein
MMAEDREEKTVKQSHSILGHVNVGLDPFKVIKFEKVRAFYKFPVGALKTLIF